MNRDQKTIEWIATGLGAGWSPIMPGTAGTLVAIPVVWLFGFSGDLAYIGLTLAFIIFSIFVCQAYEGMKEGHDRKEVVIDEIAGFLVTMALVPWSWKSVLLGFLLFRFFDIVKPPPIRWLDRNVQGGLGVVVDDLVAGVFANVILHAGFFQSWW